MLRMQKRIYDLSAERGDQQGMQMAQETADAIRLSQSSWDLQKIRDSKDQKRENRTDAHGRSNIYTPTQLEAEAQAAFFPAVGNQIKGSFLSLLEAGNKATNNAIRNRFG